MKFLLHSRFLIGFTAAFALSVHYSANIYALTLPSGENIEIVNGSIRTIGPIIINKSFSATNPNIVSTQPAVALGFNNSNSGSGNGLNLGRGLLMGENNSLSTDLNNSSGYGLVLGYNNKARVYGSIIAGSSNSVSGTSTSADDFGKFTSVFGKLNIVRSGVGGAYASFVSGGDNELTGDYSIIGGRYNILEGSTLGSETAHSVALGYSNQISAGMAWAIGQGNTLTGLESGAFGTGLNANWRGSIVLGTYNSAPPYSGGGALSSYVADAPLMVLGNGVSEVLRSNALVIRRSGNIEVMGDVFSSGRRLASEDYASLAAVTAVDAKLANSVGIAGGTSTGASAVAMSGGYATGARSVAMSGGKAYGNNSISLGFGQVTGDFSVAINGFAEGLQAVAIGGSAYGAGSLALQGLAFADRSIALGESSQAYSYKSVVVGPGGYALGDPSIWRDADTVFAVGNSDEVDSEYPTIPRSLSSNAITTLKNGQTTFRSKFWNSFEPTWITSNSEEESGGNALVVEGHSVLKGNATLQGNTVIEGQVTLVVPQGDIKMGIYQ